MKWVETTFGEFVDCNPMIKCKRNCLVENCEMEDIDANFKYLYPQQGKFYTGSGSKFQNGDTVFSRITPCLENGKIAQIKGLKNNVGVGSTEFFVFRGKANVSDNDFVYYLANSRYIRKSAENSMAGASGRQRADLNFIKSRTIRVPEQVEDQKRISSILSHYDDLIEINKRRIALLEESARELYKEWFVRMRFPGWKNIDEKDLPANWKVLRIDDIYETGSGGTPKTGNKIYYNGNINWLRTGELDDSFIFETEIKISEDGLENSSAKMYHRHDVVIAMYGATIGKLGILTGNTSVNQACCVLTPKNSFYDYAFIYLSLIEYRHELIHQRMGAAQQNISQETIRKFKLKFPPLEIMAAFNQKAHPIFDAIEVILRENQILSLQRDRLLPRLMSGQLEV